LLFALYSGRLPHLLSQIRKSLLFALCSLLFALDMMIPRRRRARESVIEALYQYDLMHDPPEQVIRDLTIRKSPSTSVSRFFRRLFDRTIAERPGIDTILTQTLEKWKLHRLPYIDRAILRMACCELLFFDDIPSSVTINEAVELARAYSDLKSAQFVNGVLDTIARSHPKPPPDAEHPTPGTRHPTPNT
jgi:transcription antitermination protein NusB